MYTGDLALLVPHVTVVTTCTCNVKKNHFIIIMAIIT